MMMQFYPPPAWRLAPAWANFVMLTSRKAMHRDHTADEFIYEWVWAEFRPEEVKLRSGILHYNFFDQAKAVRSELAPSTSNVLGGADHRLIECVMPYIRQGECFFTQKGLNESQPAHPYHPSFTCLEPKIKAVSLDEAEGWMIHRFTPYKTNDYSPWKSSGQTPCLFEIGQIFERPKGRLGFST